MFYAALECGKPALIRAAPLSDGDLA
jgi:hypothetical protein